MRIKAAKKNANYHGALAMKRADSHVEHKRLYLQDDAWKDLLPEDLVYLNRQQRRFVLAKQRKESRKNK